MMFKLKGFLLRSSLLNHHIFSIFLGILLFVPVVAAAGDFNEESFAVIAYAQDLAKEGRLQTWIGSLPMAWTENGTVRKKLMPAVKESLLRKALEILRASVDYSGRSDDQAVYTRLALETCLGEIDRLPPYVMHRQDMRSAWLDLALYLGDLSSAENLIRTLENQSTEASLTYRRAVLAALRGQWTLADALCREALTEGLPLNAAVYKEMAKWGLVSGIPQIKLTSAVSAYLKTLRYLQTGDGSAGSWLIPEAYFRGQAAFMAERYGDAVRELRSLHQPELQGVLGTMIGQAYLQMGDYRRAQTELQKVAKEHPEQIPVYPQLALAMEKQGNSEAAKHWRQLGAKRSRSLLLPNGRLAENPALPEEARLTSENGLSTLMLAGSWLKGSNGVWLSLDRGRHWIWYPLLNSKIQLPKAAEIFVLTTGSGSPQQRVVRPTISGPMVNHVNFQPSLPLPVVEVSLSRSANVILEYYIPGGPRRRISAEIPAASHRFTIDDLEPGADYFYRVIVREEGAVPTIAEGVWSTPHEPRWESLSPAWSWDKEGQRFFVVRPDAVEKGGKLRWRKAEAAAEWSAWQAVSPEMAYAVTDFRDVQRIELQYQDAHGVIMPAIHEKLKADLSPPRIEESRRERLLSGETIFLKTNEPTISHLWVRQSGSWRSVPQEARFSRVHFLPVPPAAEAVCVWVEDSAGHLTVMPHVSEGGPIPVTFRVQGESSVVNRRSVQLTLSAGDGEDMNGVMVRFSNGGGLWSPWEPWRKVKPWRIAGSGDINEVYLQVRRNETVQTLVAGVQYDPKAPEVQGLAFRPSLGKEGELKWQTDEPARGRWILLPRQGTPRIVEEEEFSTVHRLTADLTSAGYFQWILEVTDRAGNLSVQRGGVMADGIGEVLEYPTDFKIISDPGSQQVSIVLPELSPSWTAVRWRRSMGSWSYWLPYDPEMKVLLKPGLERQAIELQLRTPTGHRSPVMTRSVALDGLPPRITGVTYTVEQQTPALSWRTDEPAESWLLIVKAGGDWSKPVWKGSVSWKTAGSVQVLGLPPGEYHGRIFAKDRAGNRSYSTLIPFVVNDEKPADPGADASNKR